MKRKLNTRGLTVLAAGSAVAVASFAASADTVLQLQALTISGEAGIITIDSSDGVVIDGKLTYEIENVDIWNAAGDVILGHITSLFMEVESGRAFGPVVNLNFNVAAGLMNTTFSIAATPVAFASIGSPMGLASAEISLTDSAIGGFGAVLSTSTAAGIYTANYNSGTSVFASLFGSSLTADGSTGPATVTFGAETGAGLFTPLAGSAANIGAEWNFSLTALDLASGTSTFTVTPAPGTFALLALGGLVATRRRRS